MPFCQTYRKIWLGGRVGEALIRVGFPGGADEVACKVPVREMRVTDYHSIRG